MFRLLLVSLLCCTLAFAQTPKPGGERWPIKTSVTGHAAKTVALKELLSLPAPKLDGGKYDDKRIPGTVGADKLSEGDIITTEGYIHLVALEDDAATHRDGDYHIQISDNAESGNNCMVVEIPNPEFIKDADLKAKCTAVRAFIKDKLLHGSDPSKTGNVMNHGVYVKISGQLFYDLVRKDDANRGKKGMKAATVWELHPLTEIGWVRKAGK